MARDARLRPAKSAENHLIVAIFDGRFPIRSSLPPERDLAAHLGRTCPTLLEARWACAER